MRIILAAMVFAACTGGSQAATFDDLRIRLGLQRADECAWDDLFRRGTTNCEPCGKTRGTVLTVCSRAPKLKARMFNVVWKGKTFHGNGSFINRWPGFEAVSSCVQPGVSWFDGQPCFVMQYADDAPVFAGLRDELRQIAPGTWLGRSYIGATGQLKAYFLLQSHQSDRLRASRPHRRAA